MNLGVKRLLAVLAALATIGGLAGWIAIAGPGSLLAAAVAILPCFACHWAMRWIIDGFKKVKETS